MPRTNSAANSGTDSTDAALADHLEMDIGQDEPDTETLAELVTLLEETVSQRFCLLTTYQSVGFWSPLHLPLIHPGFIE